MMIGDSKLTTSKTVKKPADHKEKEVPFDQVEGHELLIPLAEVDAENGLELLGGLQEAGLDSDEVSVNAAAQMIRMVRHGGFVADEEGFKKFATAANVSKTLELVSAYVGELGKELN